MRGAVEGHLRLDDDRSRAAISPAVPFAFLLSVGGDARRLTEPTPICVLFVAVLPMAPQRPSKVVVLYSEYMRK